MRFLDVQLAAVILFDDAFAKVEPQAPAALFGAVPCLEHVIASLGGDTAAVVADFDKHPLAVRQPAGDNLDDAVFSLNRIDGVFDQILNGPFEQLAVEQHQGQVAIILHQPDFAAGLRKPFAEIGRHFTQHLVHVLLFQIGR